MARRTDRKIDSGSVKVFPLVRKEIKRPKILPMIAYDLETTSIREGTPKLKYLTAHGADFHFSGRVDNVEDLRRFLVNRFLLPERRGTRFVAWNANHFDVYFISAALLHDPDFILRPYLTRSNNLRGLRINLRADEKISWEFLDGISMTGCVGMKLEKFLKIFAPDHQKLTGVINFENEEFDANNVSHVAYAERDSEGLYHALVNAQSIIQEKFSIGFAPTVGNMGIKIFSAHVPRNVQVWRPSGDCLEAIRETVMRGGYCHIVQKYSGSVWKYDLNQAYAAAMRDAALPAGRAIRGPAKKLEKIPAAIYRVTATNKNNPESCPFYYRSIEDEKTALGYNEIRDTWLTSIEVEQLISEGWKISYSDSWGWEESFNMRELVDKLEDLRVNAPGGPSGAQGTMIKAVGNNAYGKTVERQMGLEMVLAADEPEGFAEYACDIPELAHIWFRFVEPTARPYHQPQLGAFITAHVRMVLRRAMLLRPKAFLYADTDCVVFSEPVEDLPIDPGKYGYWKKEVDGEPYLLIAKKVYANIDASVKHAKGMNIARLTVDDFEKWFAGAAPVQTQNQRVSFLKAMQGAEMFKARTKVGQRL